MRNQIIHIDDPQDPRIGDYIQIRERDLIGRGRRFIAEGEVVLRVLLGRSRFDVESIFVAEKRLAAMGDLLKTLPDGVPIYVASGPVMDLVVGFHIHRGILAIGHRKDDVLPGTLLESLGSPALVVALIGIANHDNMGGIFRNAAAFGADAVLLDAASCDPLYRKAIRVSVGGTLIVPFARANDEMSLVDMIDGHGFVPFALSPAGADDINSITPPERAALFLGAEGPGLPEAILERMRTLRISMADSFDSLNVATSSGIALHAFQCPVRG